MPTPRQKNVLKVKIKGTPWRVCLLSEKQHEKYCGEGIDAGADTANRYLFFKPEALDIATIKHEIFHAYFAETEVSSANLDAAQTEEVAAELFAQHNTQMAKLAKEIQRWLKTVKSKMLK